MRKLPDDAFEAYVSMGSARSYQALAEKLGVNKRTIVRRAAKENWTDRLARIQEEARRTTDKRIVETLEEMSERHLKLLRAASARVINALRQFPLNSGMEALRGAELVIKLERLVAGEPADRTALSVEEVTRREIQDLLRNDDATSAR